MYTNLLTPASLENVREPEALRQYVRLEYGREGTVWLLSQVGPPRPRPKRQIRERLRYWINTFRGFAVLDVRGSDGPSRL